MFANVILGLAGLALIVPASTTGSPPPPPPPVQGHIWNISTLAPTPGTSWVQTTLHANPLPSAVGYGYLAVVADDGVFFQVGWEADNGFNGVVHPFVAEIVNGTFTQWRQFPGIVGSVGGRLTVAISHDVGTPNFHAWFRNPQSGLWIEAETAALPSNFPNSGSPNSSLIQNWQIATEEYSPLPAPDRCNGTFGVSGGAAQNLVVPAPVANGLTWHVQPRPTAAQIRADKADAAAEKLIASLPKIPTVPQLPKG